MDDKVLAAESISLVHIFKETKFPQMSWVLLLFPFQLH